MHHPADDVPYLSTYCIDGCEQWFVIDKNHPQFGELEECLRKGDRSLIFCYHKGPDS